MEIINIIVNIFFIVSLLLKFARTLYLYYRASKIAKICGVHAGVPLSGAPFVLRGGYTNKKTHFKSYVLASPV